MNRERFDRNHRCPGSLAAHCRVLMNASRYGSPYVGWSLFFIEHDFESYAVYPRWVAKISYCPFCGKKLEEATT